ncbi:MAG TPA: hypothetical protein DIU15_08115 [Deltaproteobacteria bacterium]|nr:hypothetical protein [Deltaproteobacteria bacterium]HCP45989.1 hypothetical protein [Deltaproteobacteria bacterium]
MTRHFFCAGLALIVVGALLGFACNRHTAPATPDSAGSDVDTAQGTEEPAQTDASRDSNDPTASKGSCCKECLAASRKDPQAMDLSLLPCVDYAAMLVNGEPALSQPCISWFREHPSFVQDCRSKH